jgi:hypothetical protein
MLVKMERYDNLIAKAKMETLRLYAGKTSHWLAQGNG